MTRRSGTNESIPSNGTQSELSPHDDDGEDDTPVLPDDPFGLGNVKSGYAIPIEIQTECLQNTCPSFKPLFVHLKDNLLISHRRNSSTSDIGRYDYTPEEVTRIQRETDLVPTDEETVEAKMKRFFASDK